MKVDDIDALLFDLGGVVIDIDFNRAFARWAHHASCDQALLRARFAHDGAFKLHEVGEISDAAYFANVRVSLGIDITNAELLDGWNAIYVGEMPGIAELLSRVAAKIPVYAFSNSNPAHEMYWSKRYARLLSHFKEIYVSSTIGLRKPDAEAFEYVVKAIGVPSERIAFFDDNLQNVVGARHCGLQAVHVKASGDIAKALTGLAL
jgi:HAD superfamily hydrolase (TIGR01509 family)